MKTYCKLRVSVAIVLLIAVSSSTNLLAYSITEPGSDQQNYLSSDIGISDSVPQNVTQERLKSLTDENGNRIFPEDNEGDALQRKIFNGLVAGSYFGESLNSAGDVNGDGYDDIIVGAPNYSSNTGRAYVYFGGVNMNTVPDVILTGEAVSAYFGFSVSTAGDVNGDGYSDVVVGSQGYSSNTGRAYLFFGGPVFNNSADVILIGESAGSSFGYSVSSAGDVNGDGYSDVICGAFNYSSNTGRAYIFHGGSAMNNVSDLTFNGESTSNYFGVSVSSAGDVNGDGYSDVIIGAYGYASFAGKAYVYFGGASMNNISDVYFTGEGSSYFLGISVSTAGDFNGDGYSDIIAGSHGYLSDKGRAYILYGGASMDNIADVLLNGEASGNSFGRSVSLAGDVNGDGYSDVITGATNYSSGTGRAYVFFGGISPNNSADITITGEATNNFLGYAVSAAGDVNGDGYSDVLAGAFGYSSFTGRAYLFDYYLSNELTPEITYTGEATNNRFGMSVSSAGDVNGDGYSDIIVGGYKYSSNTGRAYIYYGGPGMDNIADVTLTGEGVNNYFGISVSTAGDINGDGYSDVIVGAYYYSSYTGRAYIYFGGSAMNNTADVTMTGEAVSNNFGYRVSTAGDVNGDGYSDVIVGASGYSTNTGKVYVYFGGNAVDNSADVFITGDSVYNYFGSSISSAGDANGDGYSDIIIGAYGCASNTGKAYLFFGGSTMNSTADLILTGDAPSNYFGYSASSAGDLNSDGYSDIMIGAYGYSLLSGKVSIYYGGHYVDNIPDKILSGESQYNYFGYSTAVAGDINSDGFADIIVGAINYNNSIGRVYIFYGGADMNTLCDAYITGEGDNNFLGISVSTAGDVNGDGYSDLIVGAYGYASYTGKAYIFKGSAISVKPILNYVKDVPNDQGGKVNLKWARSGYDVNSISTITDYVVYRSYPPSGGQFSWEVRSVVPATNRPFYTFTDDTPFDSLSGNNGTMFYRIMARTSISGQYWLSGILSGRSIDNIAPLMVSPFSAAQVMNSVLLNWNRSSAPDLLNYVLYRSTSPTIDPDTEPVFGTTVDSTYLDTSPLTGVYYYFIVAQDIHNNKSPVAIAESPNMTLNLTMFIEGFYDSGSNSQVSDTIQVELRNSTPPFALADQSVAVVSANGTAQLKFGDAANGSYYIAVKHRNSIETWSAVVIALTITIPANYDISTSSSQAFGSNMIQVDASPVRFAVFGGDVNQDGAVDATDVSAIDNDASNFVSGYAVTDLTGDDFVDGTDFAIADNNAANYVSAITP